jgi:hypothetical protein
MFWLSNSPPLSVGSTDDDEVVLSSCMMGKGNRCGDGVDVQHQRHRVSNGWIGHSVTYANMPT